MSDAIASFPFSKKNVLIRLIEPEQFAKWDKILSKIGATRNNSTEDPGWLLSKDKIDEFENALAQYGSRRRKRSRSRRLPTYEDNDSSSYEPLQSKKGSRFRGKKYDDSEHKHEPEYRCISEPDHPISHELKERTRHSPNESLGSRGTSSEEGSDYSDDELIQNVLARRLQSESSQKSIDTEFIDNSDNEDCVSYSRRLRYIYAILKEQRARILELEDRLKHRSLD